MSQIVDEVVAATIWRIARSMYLRMPSMPLVAYRGMQPGYLARSPRISKAGEGMPRAGNSSLGRRFENFGFVCPMVG